MLEIFCKNYYEESLDKYNLSKVEEDLINKCKKAFGLEIDVLKIRTDSHSASKKLDLNNIEEYKELNTLIEDINNEFENMLEEMKQNNKFNYEFLDLLLYNSVNVYLYTSEDEKEVFDEFMLPIAKTVINNFWTDINFVTFPISCNYFFDIKSGKMPLYMEVIVGANLTSYHIGNLLNLRYINTISPENQGFISALESMIVLKDRDLKIKFTKDELKSLAVVDFDNFGLFDLNTVIAIPNLILDDFDMSNIMIKDCSIDDESEYVCNGIIVRKVFDYLSMCLCSFKLSKDTTQYLLIDEYDHHSKQPAIITNIYNLPLKKICMFYNTMEFEQKVRVVLHELSDIVYYREYRKKLELMDDKLLPKFTLMMDIDI